MSQEYYLNNKERIKKHNKIYRESHRKYHKDYFKQYLRELKKWAVDKLGRKCADCGLISDYDCVYDFHHLSDNSWCKKGINKCNERMKQLLRWKRANSIPIDTKLLCANCHRIRTQKESIIT
jgi:hypothetical protein